MLRIGRDPAAPLQDHATTTLTQGQGGLLGIAYAFFCPIFLGLLGAVYEYFRQRKRLMRR